MVERARDLDAEVRRLGRLVEVLWEFVIRTHTHTRVNDLEDRVGYIDGSTENRIVNRPIPQATTTEQHETGGSLEKDF